MKKNSNEELETFDITWDARFCAATKKSSSVIQVAPAMIAAKPTPGNTYLYCNVAAQCSTVQYSAVDTQHVHRQLT